MVWDWAVGGVTDEVPRTTGPECINYMTDRRRWIEAVLFTLLFIIIIIWAVKRLKPIILPPAHEINKPHSAIRLLLIIAMTFTFGVEMGFKFSERSVIFVMNPCHIQTMLQIYLLASKPSKTTIALFRIQMNNLNGPFLAFLFPEVECRTLPFEEVTYWLQHALLYIIPAYILRSGAYPMEDLSDYNWVTIGVMIMLVYHFVVLNALSIYTGINLNHMLCAAVADPFQGQNYRIAAVIHESILCPILNKVTVLIFSSDTSKITKMPLEIRILDRSKQTLDDVDDIDDECNYDTTATTTTTPTPTTAVFYHHQQQQQQQHEMQQQQQQEHEISLAAEMAAAMNATTVGAAAAAADELEPTAILTHRRRITHTPSDNNDNNDVVLDDKAMLEQETDIATAITAEYTMPTTKID